MIKKITFLITCFVCLAFGVNAFAVVEKNTNTNKKPAKKTSKYVNYKNKKKTANGSTNIKNRQLYNECKGDDNCIKMKLKENDNNFKTIGQVKTTKRNKITRKQKRNIKKIEKIEFLDDTQIINLIDEQQRMIITPKTINVRTQNKGVPNVCLPQTTIAKKEAKRVDKDLQNAKDNLKEHIKQTLISNEVSEKLVEYIYNHLQYQKPTKQKNNDIVQRKMIDFINKYEIPKRIEKGKFYKKMYSKTLEEVEDLFYVDSNAVLAIWAMETDYGSFIGNHDAFNALYSACMNAPNITKLRYFEDNIVSLAILVDKGYFQKDVISSFDGGLGGCQFMPDSFYRFAVSMSGGKADIINKNEDVMASIGNYLHSIGWRYKEGILTEIEIPDNLNVCLIGMNTVKTIEEWKQLGVKLHPNGIGAEYFDNELTQASIILTDPNDANDRENKRAFLVYDNYKVIMGYNQQVAYGLTAGLIFEGIGE